MRATLAEELRLDQPARVAHLSLIALLFAITYLPAFAILHAKYSELDSYYGHGYLIPLVSGFVVWHKRHTLKGIPVVPSRAGLWVLAGGLLLYLFSSWWFVNVVADVSMLVVLTGLSLYLFGRSVTRALMFPLAFLVFMIPLPKISIIYITFWLKLFAARMATEFVEALGIPVLLQRAFIQLPNGLIEVDNACSGLRSLISLLALGVVFAYFLPVSRLMKVMVAVLSIPVAVAANLTRIVTVILVSYLYAPTGRAFEMVDFATGLSVFAIALAGLAIVSKGAVVWERYRLGASAQG